MSDIEETMSILSRRSRSTTPISATLQRSVSENRVTGNRVSGNNHFTNPAFALETLLENTPYGSLDRRLKTKSTYEFQLSNLDRYSSIYPVNLGTQKKSYFVNQSYLVALMGRKIG